MAKKTESTFPANTVKDIDNVVKHMEFILTRATMLDPSAAQAAVNMLPEGKQKEDYQKVADLVISLTEWNG